jgi:hypothetical protein
MILYRPVGQVELDLIEETGFTKFPPRLFYQPIFYPVLNEKYASEIALRWNTKDSLESKNVGYVTRFEVDDEFISKYEVHQVGDKYHLEYWIPSEELEDFNNHIINKIEVIKCYK